MYVLYIAFKPICFYIRCRCDIWEIFSWFSNLSISNNSQGAKLGQNWVYTTNKCVWEPHCYTHKRNQNAVFICWGFFCVLFETFILTCMPGHSWQFVFERDFICFTLQNTSQVCLKSGFILNVLETKHSKYKVWDRAR